MSDISELEGRITAALDRIGHGLERLSKPVEDGTAKADAKELTQLRGALDDEKTANAMLEERVKAIKEKQDNTVASLTEEVERLHGLLGEEEAGLARLQKVNAELRANNETLRAAISDGVAEPHLVNKSMMAELEALRAAQASDRAELDAVLGELAPLVQKAEEGHADA